jgi:hypothetical protein
MVAAGVVEDMKNVANADEEGEENVDAPELEVLLEEPEVEETKEEKKDDGPQLPDEVMSDIRKSGRIKTLPKKLRIDHAE